MTPIPFSPAAGARFLSNGHLRVLVTAAGTGATDLGGHALTRWQGDPVEDGDGYFIYLRDIDSGEFWSVGAQPCAAAGARHGFGGDDGGAWLTCRHLGIEARLDIVVATETDVELRTLTLRNTSARARRIEVTSYLEVVLNKRAAEASHPAFSKLFVQTESVPEAGALLARRRPRGADDACIWLVHAASGSEDAGIETDRKRFIGRGRSLAAPAALASSTPLSGTAGNVLDPSFSLRRNVALEPDANAVIVFTLGAAPDRDAALALLAGAPAPEVASRMAGERRAALLTALALDAEQGAYAEALAAAILYGESALRAAGDTRLSTDSLPDTLGLPKDRMLCMVTAIGPRDPHAQALLDAARYWDALALPLHLVLVGAHADWPALPGPVTLLDPALVDSADLERVAAQARMVVKGELPVFGPRASILRPPRPPHRKHAQDDAEPAPLRFFNGDGGFSNDGKEYVIRLAWDGAEGLSRPPLPWTNVIANEQVGVLVSETGAGTTWSRNSREHRLTPWFNDPVRDPHGEALYLRDEDDGSWWSPMPGPAPAAASYEAVHGFGYTTFRHASYGLEQECTVFVPRHDPLKIVRIRLRNTDARSRTISLFSYQQLVLGSTAADSGRHICTTWDAGVLLATNRMAGPFADGVTFAALIAPPASASFHSADRAAFIGTQGTSARPAALGEARLDGRTGPGLDPCAAFQARLTIAPGEEVEFAVLLGETTCADDAQALVRRYRASAAVEQALAEVRQFWLDTVGAIEIDTPVPAIDLMVNGWLAYQNLSCRIWGRSAFYQSGGAIGYRDQLQDASALIYTLPEMTRKQICLHAAHQFTEGDVLHWWHPAPLEKGLRTRFSDDLLWLPYITAFYLKSTGDWSVLDEVEGFLSAPQLEDGEDEVFLHPEPAGTSADVYEHCCRALDRSLTKGAHGLPLMGTGDWNDGMSRVGREGRGESVWMGFFLFRIIGDFLPVCERRGDSARISAYSAYREHLAVVLNGEGWDGQWYRRAFYDNGAVMGSSESDECQIDALAQAWSVISGAAPLDRARMALDAMEERLVSDADGLIRLLTPPFVHTAQDPGYIKGYVAGVRENGGQYTHAACWAVRALAEAGRNERAAQLLEMLSPISHALTPEAVARYQVEPYVIAADIYGADPHVGRGGWTWYTGSAGWAFRVALESVLGFTLEGGAAIRMKPVVPAAWPRFGIRYRLPDGATSYHIEVINDAIGDGSLVVAASLDGQQAPIVDGAAMIPMKADGAQHRVVVVLRAA
ncbi:glycosyl transferase [Massilia sp. CCM 8733]|uniref:Glycosyl transferase n=1 Tax=Massilia mucilaginosa TaxID=2609282 RepID=A0ABX0NSY8_9BURK|nr:glycosyl transferase [Massilia mucilaginosa]NHZ90021.1 glycosyl transferase [Massilia mucilaginosa]